MNKKLWLITGVPGTGKTSIGNWLGSNYDFQHFDFENPAHFQDFVVNGQFIIPSKFNKNNVVITWGFVPDHGGISIVSLLKQNGFKMYWFDGNRIASLKAFLNRGGFSEEIYYLQMHRIENSKVVDVLNPILINPFNSDYSFKNSEDIVRELDKV